MSSKQMAQWLITKEVQRNRETKASWYTGISLLPSVSPKPQNQNVESVCRSLSVLFPPISPKLISFLKLAIIVCFYFEKKEN